MKIAAFCWSLFALSAPAQACPSQTAWGNASHVQASLVHGALRMEGEITVYADASLSRLTVDGEESSVLQLKGEPWLQRLSFTRAVGRLAPQELSELVMLVEPPMIHGPWPRFPRPCAMPDGVVMNFTGADNARWDSAAHAPLHGSAVRRGTRISYTMRTREDGLDWESSGSASYAPATAVLPPATDLQGWQVYRDNVYLLTLPQGAPIPLAAALARLPAP